MNQRCFTFQEHDAGIGNLVFVNKIKVTVEPNRLVLRSEQGDDPIIEFFHFLFHGINLTRIYDGKHAMYQGN
jgi:hypothetical protein